MGDRAVGRRSASWSARMPGLSATMATALLGARSRSSCRHGTRRIGAIVTGFGDGDLCSGDIPGGPAAHPGHAGVSRLYRRRPTRMTRKGQAGAGARRLRCGSRALGGIAGTLSLMIAGAAAGRDGAATSRPIEYFWLALLRADVRRPWWRAHRPVKAIASMLIGLLRRPASASRTRPARRASPSACTDLLGGIEPIPALVGVFAASRR